LLNEAQLRRVMASGIVGMVVWDAAGRVRDANDRFLDMVGYGRSELESGAIGIEAITPPEWRAADESALGQMAAGGRAAPFEKEYSKRDGSRVPVRVFSTPLDTDARTVMSIVIDITERKNAERDREALHVRERAAREDAEAAVRDRDEILAIVSHDLRNPLQTLTMSIGVLETVAGEAGRGAVAAAHRAVARMNGLIQDLLDVNQIVSGRFRVEPVPLQTAAICEDARAMVGAICQAKRQRFECEAGDGPARVHADRNRIAQVISNLLGNAAKFTPEGGRISLRISRAGADALFEVADTGPGISGENLPHIFDRFWQAGRLRRGGGVGLGLPIAKGIVQAHGGRIWAESEPGQGTRFFFTLPTAA
jgi:PAS domain S-box-containing protein